MAGNYPEVEELYRLIRMILYFSRDLISFAFELR
jgi:hypothetical protein